MSPEPGDEGNIKTMGKEATSKDIRGENEEQTKRSMSPIKSHR